MHISPDHIIYKYDVIRNISHLLIQDLYIITLSISKCHAHNYIDIINQNHRIIWIIIIRLSKGYFLLSKHSYHNWSCRYPIHLGKTSILGYS